MSNMIQVQGKMNYVLIAVNAVSMEQFVLLVQSLMYMYFFLSLFQRNLSPVESWTSGHQQSFQPCSTWTVWTQEVCLTVPDLEPEISYLRYSILLTHTE